ncbi:hypothetical protein L3Y34_016186 [Caenorhabditis briggsae]|uniref:Uncharacterized protein n=2 Tax=Caenorhabditis briggsae TaxID=6238 RepID=A0AAE9DVM7_CAEBR|nr:hypothetical protein L3Y34_016186 [Caenorhabditis briggsae]
MISIENVMHHQQHQSTVNGGTGPPNASNQIMSNGSQEHPAMIGRGISSDLPTAYVTSTPLPLAKAQQLHPMQQMHQAHLLQNTPPHIPYHHYTSQPDLNMMESQRPAESPEQAEASKNARIASLFEEIRLEAQNFPQQPEVKEEAIDDEDQPTELGPQEGPLGVIKKKILKKRKSDLALEMTADDVDDILGESTANPSNFNPKNPFGGPSPSGLSNGFADLGSPGSSSLKSSPPLSKYAQNNQGQRGSPPNQGFPTMSPYMTPQMNSPLHPQLQQQNSATSPPVTMHSPGQVPEFKPTIINGVVMNPLAGHPPLNPVHHHLPHHTRFLQHQQSAPNLRLGTPDDSQKPPMPFPYNNGQNFDITLVQEFDMCVRSVMMASNRVYCRHVYRQLTAEVSELYARVAKNQVPKKAVKKIVAARQPATHGERIELERQFKCLSDGLESRQSPQLYESILNFLYKMRVAIPDANQ